MMNIFFRTLFTFPFQAANSQTSPSFPKNRGFHPPTNSSIQPKNARGEPETFEIQVKAIKSLFDAGGLTSEWGGWGVNGVVEIIELFFV